MEWIFPIFSLLVFSGLLFYFRWTDAKNADVRSLRDYIRSVEKEIQQFIRSKEKDFNDKIIPAEVAIDTMNNLAQTLQKKVEEFDQYLSEGEDLYRSLHQEMGSISGSLKDYRAMREDFKGIEKKMGDLALMRDIVAAGNDEITRLRGDMHSLKDEYDSIMISLTTESKTELENFFKTMQSDLTTHLSRAQSELENTDQNIRSRIEDLKESTKSLDINIQDFKEQLENEMLLLSSMAEARAAEIIDRWNSLKEQNELDIADAAEKIESRQEFFLAERNQIRNEIENVHNILEKALGERLHDLDSHSGEIQERLKNMESSLRSQLEAGLDEKLFGVRRQLDQTQNAFAAQEEELSKKLEDISSAADARVKVCENELSDTIESLQNRVHNVTETADKILNIADQKIDEKIKEFNEVIRSKVNENMQNLEESFRQENDSRLRSGIEEITKLLEERYTEEFQKNLTEISESALLLEQQVSEKIASVKNLDERLIEIHNAFSEEKDQIILMTKELEEDRTRHTQIVEESLARTTAELQQDMQVRLAEFFEDHIQAQRQEQNEWTSRYDETLIKASTAYNSIKNDVDAISREVKEIENKTLTSLREESERFLNDTARRLDDLKYTAETMTRENKEIFAAQMESARKTISDLKQDLWNQETKVRDQAQKDLERLSDRVRSYEKHLSEFIKKTEVLERLEGAAEKFQGRMQELENLKKDLEHLAAEINTARIEGQATVGEIQDKSRLLENNIDLLAQGMTQATDVCASLDNSIQEAHRMGEFLTHLEQEKENIRGIEALLQKNIQSYDALQETLDELENRKRKVDEMLLSIDSVQQMTADTAAIRNTLSDMGRYTIEQQEQIAAIQESLAAVVAEKDNLRRAIDSINDLENIIEHVRQERASVEQMVSLMAKASSSLKNSGSNDYFSVNGEGSEQISIIMGLYRQNWSISDIAKNLKLSPAFVELTINKHK